MAIKNSIDTPSRRKIKKYMDIALPIKAHRIENEIV